jgi:serine/threonine protein phosphatase PrpC
VAASEGLRETLEHISQRIQHWTTTFWDMFTGDEGETAAHTQGTRSGQGGRSRRQLSPMPSGAIIDNYSVVARVYPLPYSNYYEVYDLTCRSCGKRNQPDAPPPLCAHCQQPIMAHLVHESANTGGDLNIKELMALSSGSPYIIPHQRVCYQEDRTYVWLPLPLQWGSLAKVRLPLEASQAALWGQQIGAALATLNANGYYGLPLTSLEKIIIENGAARLADLTDCHRPRAGYTEAEQRRGPYFLARILYYLLTGRDLVKEREPAAIPEPLQTVIQQGIRGDYQNIEEMVADLSTPRAQDDYGFSLKPVSGKASSPGRVRQNNEDSLLAFEMTRVQESQGVPLSFYVVADGMGGHQAGEIASRTVNNIVTERILNAQVIPGLSLATRRLDNTPNMVLDAAVRQANEVLYAEAQARGNDMGTTLTATLIIGNVATIANVGDSRTYLLRGSTLRQISKDHSLVASLVAAGMLRPEEVRGHPQSNQIYRTLGAKPQVEVDIFTETLQRGDRLILCSDGLWEMVSDEEIAQAVITTSSPQAACDALIRSANRAGGHDNVTVIVIKLE